MHLPANTHRRTRRGVRERSTQQPGTSQPASSTSWPADPRMATTRSRVHPSAKTNKWPSLCAGQDAIPKKPISRLDTCECELAVLSARDSCHVWRQRAKLSCQSTQQAGERGGDHTGDAESGTGGPKLGTWAGAARVGALRSVLSGPEGHYCCVRQMRSISPVILRRC